MSYYTQRHGMRQSVGRTYQITPQMYELLFKCCEKYCNNIAWKFPKKCDDGDEICGLDWDTFSTMLKFEIPNLYCGYSGRPDVPIVSWNTGNTNEYDQFALLDYIEFFAQNCRDVYEGTFHRHFGHHHLTFGQTDKIFKNFQLEINELFEKTGLLYHLTNGKIIERIVENSPLTPEIEETLSQVKEPGLKELFEEALSLYRRPSPRDTRDAVEKLWDAFERLKTYYNELDKKNSVNKIVNDMAGGETRLAEWFDLDFQGLSNIGNGCRIRHHERDKVEVTDPRHYDYFFNRCLSLIALAIQYLD